MNQQDQNKRARRRAVGTRGLLQAWYMVLLLVFAIILSLVGYQGVVDGAGWGASVLSAGIIGGFIVLAALPIVVTTRKSPGGRDQAQDRKQDELLRLIQQQTMLSDRAKQVLYRKDELGMLRLAIEEDIARADYDAALKICNDMAELYGYREEAESFRNSIEQFRRKQYLHQVNAEMEAFNMMLDSCNWNGAHEAAARMRRLFPDAPQTHELEHRFHMARDSRKRDLESDFMRTVKEDDTTGAMDILKELDQYLNQADATRLSQVVQDLVGRHRDRISEQFKAAVNRHDWDSAISIAEVIMREFPNTRIAKEVSAMMEAIRHKATGTRANVQDSPTA